MDADSDSTYRHLVNSVADYAIFALDGSGRVVTWNTGAERIKGYSAAEIVGRHFSMFYPPEAAANGALSRKLEIAARDGRVEDEGWRVRKDGTRFWANVVISAMRNGQGKATGFAKVTREVDQARAMGDALRDSEKSFSLLVQSVTDYAILLLDPDGRVTSWNEGAERIKGYKAGEIIGHSFRRFYPPEAVAAGLPERELETAARDGRFEDEDWRVRKDGSRFWANVVVTALRNDAGELLGYAKVTRDLTARREAENQARKLAVEEAQHAEATRRSEELASLNERLRRSNDELRSALEAAEDSRHAAEEAASAMAEAYRQLDQFAYIASHDLKAPLRGIANLAQWIQDDAADELSGESAEHLRLLQGRVQRMEALIDGILAYSRAGRVTAVPEKVDTGALVREVIDLVAPPEGVTIVVPDDLPTLETELLPLQQVFMNLIVNAVKYSGATRADATVHIGWRDTGEAIEFFVRDNGPGIAPEFHERVWGIFQVLTARDKNDGTGVGLAVVKKVVEGRGGRVLLESTPGEGATFHFTWPT
ncbi:MAG TPA: PAS domain S-box protein [Woeseiaceae bacterium]|nr:PAS domain S-box protein [Woeseiaceae bacterium]